MAASSPLWAAHELSTEERSITMSQKLPSPTRSISSCSSKQGSRQDSWEIVEGLRGGLTNVQEPQKQEGFLLKRRKWPMKGWHKRYFFLDKGILKYAKCGADIEKGKLHGCIDVGLSVMAIKKKAKCIDLDTEENIYHLKINSQELFDEWVSKLRHHRLYRQNEIAMYPHEKPLFYSHFPPSVSPNLSDSRSPLTKQSSIHTPGNFPMTFNNQTKVAAWLQSSDDMDKCSKGTAPTATSTPSPKHRYHSTVPHPQCVTRTFRLTPSLSAELSVCESYLLELNHLLRSMEVLHRTYSAPAINALQASTFDSPKKEKRPPRKWRSKNYGKDAKTTLQVPSCISSGSIRLHASNPNLSTAALGTEKNYTEIPDSPTDVSKLQEDFCLVANNLHATMKSAFSSLSSERERLKQVLDHEACQPPTTQIMGLKNALSSAIAQNAELRERLCRIHAESRIVEPTVVINHSTSPPQKQDSTDGSRPLVHQVSNESRASITESLSEFFDAQEVLLSASSSENEASEDDSYISDISDNISMDNFSNEAESDRPSSGCVENGALQRRRRACLAAPSPNTSSISLWNILKNNIGKDLSKVAMPVQLNEPLNTLQRLCEELDYYRAGGKPFNPVLGETYECDRRDKGFRFIAEQVSHHPPISACHAESKNFTFWQDMRWKNKFWGKSMEIVPVGTTHVLLPGFGDHYEWNKVTSCIHNILSGQRWIEHYGEISIKNSNSDICQCKVTFVKFAIELNELDTAEKPLLPPTDTRLRMDQRLLEEGNVESAEVQKQRIEQLQRERRRVLEENGMTHQPRFFKKSEDDTWVSNNTYWDLKKDPGFSNLDCPVLW
ncbi:hypothetical protein JZ751_009718 [Albula glossodonta]|uniref:Oxysterol-binding protein n=1 Tax=Albula glossodonta TaxID=121402 RepID=A0A8T2NXX0_9TELE|nr:hypothetical protein JZ751_009718 [Albula glossodonta]